MPRAAMALGVAANSEAHVRTSASSSFKRGVMRCPPGASPRPTARTAGKCRDAIWDERPRVRSQTLTRKNRNYRRSRHPNTRSSDPMPRLAYVNSVGSNGVISISGAREHNLRDIDVVLPRNSLVVITGLSGSGKSSLAFDTIYAEGQRRYVESLSAYARQFLGQMEKPDVDVIDGLSPAISIDQKGTSRNPRSTVGTVTEVYDYLRLLFARIGRPHCPICGREIQMSQDYACPYDGISVPEPEPRNFSFNTPHGACPTCTGLGSQLVVDPDLVIPDPGLSLRDGAIAPWSKSQFFYPEMLEAVCESAGIDMGVPASQLTRKQLDLLLNGSGKQKIKFGYRNQYGVR